MVKNAAAFGARATARTEAGKRSGQETRRFSRPIRNLRSPQPIADHPLAVYDGQHRVGSVVERDGEFLAFDNHDRRVGVFTNQREALRAIPAARSS